MEKSLGINDSQYNVGLSIFFVSYAVFEVRSLIRIYNPITEHIPDALQCLPQEIEAFVLAVFADGPMGHRDDVPRSYPQPERTSW
jgi:hypothetical protein